MITLLLPTAYCPFFIEAVCKNIKETSGISEKQIDLNFIITADATDKLKNLLEKTGFNVLQSPISDNNHGVHLKLLDWAIKFGVQSKWIYVQHMDMFWEKSSTPWLKTIMDEIENSEEIALTIPDCLSQSDFKHKWHKFAINGINLLRTHDFSGVYNREKLIDMDLKFAWGKLNELNISKELKEIIELKKLRWIHRGLDVKIDDELDGSDLIGLEITARCPKKIKALPIKNNFIHSWDMLNLYNKIIRDNKTIYIDNKLENSTRAFSSYSWISSHLFDKKEMRDKIIPWPFVKNLSKFTNVTCEKTKICQLLERYAETINDGNDMLGVEKIEFKDFTLMKKKYFL